MVMEPAIREATLEDRFSSTNEDTQSKSDAEQSIGEDEYLPPNPSGSVSPADSITSYARMLQQIPGFTAYTYAETTSGSSAGPSATLSRRSERAKSAVAAAVLAVSPQDMSSGRMVSLNAVNLVPLLPRVKDIGVCRDRLFQRQLIVEDTHRQMAECYKEITQEVKKATQMPQQYNASRSHITCPSELKSSLSRLAVSLKKLKSGQHDLQPQQRSLSLAQADLKGAIDEFYAFLTDGAQLSESDASEEDRKLEALLSANTSIPSGNALHVDDHFEEVTSEYKPEAPQSNTAKPQTAGSPVFGKHRRDRSQQQTYVNPKDRPETTSRPTQVRTRSGRFHVGRWSELAFCGENLAVGNLDKYRESAEASSLLSSSASLKAIRRLDLRPELTATEENFLRSADDVKEPSVPISRGMIQGLEDIRVPSYHFREIVLMWGTNMSQNSWTNFLRSVLFERPRRASGRKGLSNVAGRLDATAMTSMLRALDIATIQISMRKTPSTSLPILPPQSTVDNLSVQVQLGEHNGTGISTT